MKPSHYQTPRTLADCTFVTGHSGMHESEPLWEIVAGYVLAIVIGIVLATILFYGLSK
jgi:ABC-type nitrate/sulfonate/bicarbonate transport system permease component